MNYLLDTQVLLWWLENNKRLKENIRKILENPENNIFISVVSAWEIAIKQKTKKGFQLKTSIKTCFEVSEFTVIDITLPHVLALERLETIHKDPFDRMLIVQSLVEKLTLISDDQKIKRYQVKLLST